MRKINRIIIHCSATPEGKDFTVADITRWHKAQGYSTIGYHYVIYRDGSVHAGRPEEEVGAHCKGYNANSIGVCYIGGVASDGKTPKDTRTNAQKAALNTLVDKLLKKYPDATVHGHREFAAKACPSFDVKKEFSATGKSGIVKNFSIGMIIGLISAMAISLLSGCSDTKYLVAHTNSVDTVRVVSFHTDTLISRDSVFVDRETKNDTVRITQTLTKWREKISLRTDTFWRWRTDTIVDSEAIYAVEELQKKLSIADNKVFQVKEQLNTEKANKRKVIWGLSLWIAFLMIAIVVLIKYRKS